MLSLLDPVEIEDLVLFRDDLDPRKFYLLPDQPVIPLDDQGVPEFLFIKYLRDVAATPDGADVGGGWVQFRSALTIAPDRRQRVIDALAARLAEEKAAGEKPLGNAIEATDPLLADPLWTDGKVGLVTFQASDTGLVRHSTTTSPADLAGGLGASFGLELSPDGAEIFWGAFKNWSEQQLPILVDYQLTYTARVSATLSIHARQQVIHDYLWRYARPYRLLAATYSPIAYSGLLNVAALATLRASAGAPVMAMIERPHVAAAIDQARLDKTIDIRIDIGDMGGDETQKVQDLLYKVATEVLSDHLIPAFFPDGAQPGGGGDSGTSSSTGLFKLQEQGPEDASFDLELTQQSTVPRTVNPNGSIHLLLGSPQALASCFRELRLTDGFFSLMKVSAQTSGVNFESDGIDSIHVFFRYHQVDEGNPDRPLVDRQADGMLRSEKDAVYFRFDTARDAQGGHKKAYQVRTDVFYKGGPPSSTDWVTRSDQMLQVTPRAMGALRVELALTAGKDAVAGARVDLRHQAADGGTYQTALDLTPEASRQSWFQYTGDLAPDGAEASPPAYTYQVRYRTAGGEILMAPVTTTDKTVEIPSPFVKVITFTVRPRGSFDGVASLAGDIAYEDAAHGYRVTKPFQLQKLTDSFDFPVPILAGGPEVASWTARRIRADGSSDELPAGQGPAGTVWVGEEVDLSMVIQVRADLIDFDADVQLAVVELAYTDPAGGDPERATLTFSKAARAPQTWRVDRRDKSFDRYDAGIRYIAYDRAKSSEVHLTQIDDQVLLLDRAPQP